MIFDRIANLSRYKGIHPNLDKAIAYLQQHNWRYLPKGKFHIDGDNVFGVHEEFDGYDDEHVMYETHQKYADLHILVDKNEKYFYEQGDVIKNVIEPYNDQNDVAFFKVDAKRTLLKPVRGEFVFFFPGEAHGPKYIGIQGKLKKIIIKMKFN
ncbi:YhcH/YjgK/YiaL family protein [[Mycoplasma] testudinis]|uniref:YhcH/YjgK/YiaL family protein n=1 Tax=[Mycoplasma] testudinis TaxID=33924 RepID=UPI0004874A74|nr:YhcH/YjgK/YiaL family protein [[Mycoplasma] testudinis]